MNFKEKIARFTNMIFLSLYTVGEIYDSPSHSFEMQYTQILIRDSTFM